MGSLPRIPAALLVLVLSFSIPILLNFVRSPPSILLFLRSLCSPFSFFSFLSLFSSFFPNLLFVLPIFVLLSILLFLCSLCLLSLSLLSFILARDIDCQARTSFIWGFAAFNPSLVLVLSFLISLRVSLCSPFSTLPFSFSRLSLFSPSSVSFFLCLSSFSLSLISLLSLDVLSVIALFCLCWLSTCRPLVWVGWMAGVGLPNVLFFSHGECRSHPLSRYSLTFSLVPRQVETFDMLKYHWMAYSLLLPRSGATILPLLHPWIGSSTFPTNMVWLLCPSYELGRAC